MKDLRNYTVKEFAQAINENAGKIQEMVRECISASYTSNPVQALEKVVVSSNINENNKSIVIEFLYTTLYNKPVTPFRNGRGFGLEIR